MLGSQHFLYLYITLGASWKISYIAKCCHIRKIKTYLLNYLNLLVITYQGHDCPHNWSICWLSGGELNIMNYAVDVIF